MIRRALAAAAVVVLAGTTLPASAAPDPVTEIHQLTNAERAKAGLPALQRSDCLDNAAQQWSARMAARGQVYHSDLDFMAACGASAVGENVLGGSDTNAADALRLWMDSKGHRANILNRDWTHIGVGYVDGYATQTFARGITVNRTDRATPPDRTPAPSRGLAKTGVTP